MKAVKLRNAGGLDKLLVEEVPEPAAPGPGEITVRIRASSLNYHDYGVVTTPGRAANGLVPLSDGAGDVIAVGDGDSEFRVGDRVIGTFFQDWLDGPRPDTGFMHVPGDGCDGFAREIVTMSSSAFTTIPAGFSFEEAATLPCAGLTAWRGLVLNGQVGPQDAVLVQGTGGVSVFALQFAKAIGATVIATSSSDEKLKRLRALGADHLINYKRTPDWGARAQEITGGVDHVIEVGGPGTLEQSLVAVRTGGHISLIGILTGFHGTVPTATVMRRQLKLIGVMVGSRAHQQAMIADIEKSGLRPVIDRTFPLEQLAEAFRYEESGRHFGKISVSI